MKRDSVTKRYKALQRCHGQSVTNVTFAYKSNVMSRLGHL